MIDERVFEYYPELARVRQLVLENLDRPISLTEAARAARLHPKYLSRLFREKTGITYSEWLRSTRIERAMELLRARHSPILEVAHGVGYQDLSTFYRAFKHYSGGLSPAAWRRAHAPEPRSPLIFVGDQATSDRKSGQTPTNRGETRSRRR
jgi:AraC-like DNA-binding protein